MIARNIIYFSEKQFLLLNLCGILSLYVIFLKSFEDEIKTSIMIQHFNKIINNNIAIANTQLEEMSLNINDSELEKQECYKNVSIFKSNITNQMNGFTCSILSASDERECR